VPSSIRWPAGWACTSCTARSDQIQIVPDYHLIAAEFALGRVLATSPLSGGGPDVVKLTTTSGDWVIKPGSNRTTAELYPRVASSLNAAGLRQAVPRLTVAGFPVSVSGYPAQEFLPGRICLQPTAAQIAATMRHIAEYHRVLEQLRPPAQLSVADTIFQRVASAEFLLRELPGLVRDPGTWPEQPTDCQQTVEVALGLVHDSLPLLNQLPTQLVHGDIGPDNVLMNGDDVVSIIDFTPYDEPFLFALSSAVYWYHSYGRDDLDQKSIRDSVAAAGYHRPWTELEAAAWPAMLVREALRRLATPLAVAGQAGTPADALTVAARYRALRSLIGARPRPPVLAPQLPTDSSHSKRTN
jgi:Ser/Thr protein kinase RdoA (MazF antagonist)